jgi:hypothetical protein
MSAVTGTFTARAVRPTASIIASSVIVWRSSYPRECATAQLAVATAG